MEYILLIPDHFLIVLPTHTYTLHTQTDCIGIPIPVDAGLIFLLNSECICPPPHADLISVAVFHAILGNKKSGNKTEKSSTSSQLRAVLRCYFFSHVSHTVIRLEDKGNDFKAVCFKVSSALHLNLMLKHKHSSTH